MWHEWGDAWRKWKETVTSQTSPFHAERQQPEEWRLTAEGITARKDLRAGKLSLVYEFVLKSDFFRNRKSVQGRSELKRLDRKHGADEQEPKSTALPGVRVENWQDGAAAMASALATALQRMSPAGGGTEADVSKTEINATPEVAVRMPFGCGEIFTEVRRPNERAEQERLKRLNSDFEGPIAVPSGKGKQPTVACDALVTWWNALAEQYQQNRADKAARDEEAKLNAGELAQHDYGRTGKVATEINGSVRGKRSRKNPNGHVYTSRGRK